MCRSDIALQHLVDVISNHSKIDHNLVLSDLCVKDRQNYSSCEKISSPSVLEILRMNSKILFLILWVSCVFVFFQLIATKYLSYTYPLVFPSALLLGKYFADNRGSIKYNRAIIWNSFFYVANCQVKCDTSCKKTSIADFQPRHFRGLELIRNRLCISSISFTRERSVFLG